MLGGLARWLRVAGYDASWRATIDDWDLVRLARSERRILLSSDTGIFEIGIVRDGEVSSLFVPHGLGLTDQLVYVLTRLKLPLQSARCMACGGSLAEVSKEQVRGNVPERTYAWREQFWKCERCGQVFWQGTHWRQIAERLEQLRVKLGSAN
jgi:uncharacterized protein with PIN domain